MSQITVLNKSNAPTGPFTRTEIADKLRTGEIALTDLAFVEGLSAWTPLCDVLAKVDGAPVSAPPVLAAPVVAAPAYSYAATMQPPGHLVYAGFWLRLVAIIIDGIVVGIPMGILGGIIGAVFGVAGGKVGFADSDGNINGSFIVMELSLVTISLVVKWLYYALQESSAAQATIGKRVMSIKVTNLEGQRIGFGQASGRFFSKILSGLIFCIGYIMAGFTERKQALHDMIAGTLVVRG